ncbi:MAG: hypothetical protein FWH40_00795 [Coriobacteriia bacterium]|nr:hypothetical protein [Coriobacteriia bacterium]
MGIKRKKSLSLILTIGLILSALAILPSTAFADPPGLNDYNLGDIAFVNNLIDDNSLSWAKWNDDEPNQPSSWDAYIHWADGSGDDYPYRIHELSLNGLGLTALNNLPGDLVNLYCSQNNLTALPDLPGGLLRFTCANNQLVALTDIPSTLLLLDVEDNMLTGLPPLPGGLQYLYCASNQLPALTVLPGGLIELSCGNNLLTALPGLPTTLDKLLCANNQLATLPTLPSLTLLECNDNLLTALPTLPGSLNVLNCNSNSLTDLPTLTDDITFLDCGGNSLTGLPVLPGYLDTLICSGNDLPGLPTLPGTLTYLDCSNNILAGIQDPLPGGLVYLDCSSNELTGIPVPLPSGIESLNISDNLLTAQPLPLPNALRFFDCSDNQISSIDISNCPNLAIVRSINNLLVSVVLSDTLTVKAASVGDGNAYIVYFEKEAGSDGYWFAFVPFAASGADFLSWDYEDEAFFSTEPDNNDPEILWAFIVTVDYRTPEETIVTANFSLPQGEPGNNGVPTGDLRGIVGGALALSVALLGLGTLIVRRRQTRSTD